MGGSLLVIVSANGTFHFRYVLRVESMKSKECFVELLRYEPIQQWHRNDDGPVHVQHARDSGALPVGELTHSH
jgi:hypothetical protein